MARYSGAPEIGDRLQIGSNGSSQQLCSTSTELWKIVFHAAWVWACSGGIDVFPGKVLAKASAPSGMVWPVAFFRSWPHVS